MKAGKLPKLNKTEKRLLKKLMDTGSPYVNAHGGSYKSQSWGNRELNAAHSLVKKGICRYNDPENPIESGRYCEGNGNFSCSWDVRIKLAEAIQKKEGNMEGYEYEVVSVFAEEVPAKEFKKLVL